MHEIVGKNKCSGCHACYNICPSKCIEMEADKDGFLFPQINESLCIDCGLCKEVCPINNRYSPYPKGKAYACINKNEVIRMDSSSGGMFSLLAAYVINNGGVVFGAAFDKDLSVHHIEIDKIDDLHLLRGSKYIQSVIGDTYKYVKKHLKNGRIVLFSGTPCQISGLKNYLECDYENLIMIDIVCHGVPSPEVWKSYLRYQEEKNHSKINKNIVPKFRDKEYGWKNYQLDLSFENGDKYCAKSGDDYYMKAFINNLSLRPSCYDCHSKSIERESDITLADFWGIENIMPEMDDDKGTSLMLVNSEKGKKLFECVRPEIIYKPVNIDDVAKYNYSMYNSSKYTPMREKFMKEIHEEKFDVVVKKYTKLKTVRRIVKYIKKLVEI